MRTSGTSLLLLLLAIACWCGLGCNGGNTEAARETQSEGNIPAELLDPESIESLSISISNDLARQDLKLQPLKFASDSPEASAREKFLLWLAWHGT